MLQSWKTLVHYQIELLVHTGKIPRDQTFRPYKCEMAISPFSHPAPPNAYRDEHGGYTHVSEPEAKLQCTIVGEDKSQNVDQCWKRTHEVLGGAFLKNEDYTPSQGVRENHMIGAGRIIPRLQIEGMGNHCASGGGL